MVLGFNNRQLLLYAVLKMGELADSSNVQEIAAFEAVSSLPFSCIVLIQPNELEGLIGSVLALVLPNAQAHLSGTKLAHELTVGLDFGFGHRRRVNDYMLSVA